MVNPDTCPGSTLFVNKLGLTDPKKYELAQSTATVQRKYEIEESLCPVAVNVDFDLHHLKQIHHHLFQDLFEWAGEFRSYNMRKGEDVFTSPELLEKEVTYVMNQIKGDNFLIGSSEDYFIERMAQYIGWFGLIHPFPEGNGRTQRAFLILLAKNAGRKIRFDNIRDWQNKESAIQYHRTRNLEPLKILIRDTLP